MRPSCAVVFVGYGLVDGVFQCARAKVAQSTIVGVELCSVLCSENMLYEAQ